jgi:soluble lytic murein transglycosylase-like protein
MAEDELRHLNPQGHHDLQEAMLALAEAARMPSVALQLGGLATNDNGKRYDAALYPVPPWEPEQGFQVDRALLYALIRHESQFDPTAVSDRGACGLMQLMPTTANLIANHRVAGHGCSDRLLEPSYNMALGQKYVRHLAGQPMIGDNLLFLLAAYNGGPSKVSRWVDDDSRRDPLLFIESLPVRETHDYVQQVLLHYWTYRARLAEPQTSLAQLAHGQWPRYALRDDGTAKKAVSVEPLGFTVASNQP